MSGLAEQVNQACIKAALLEPHTSRLHAEGSGKHYRLTPFEPNVHKLHEYGLGNVLSYWHRDGRSIGAELLWRFNWQQELPEWVREIFADLDLALDATVAGFGERLEREDAAALAKAKGEQ